jgi:hypothetical protein
VWLILILRAGALSRASTRGRCARSPRGATAPSASVLRTLHLRLTRRRVPRPLATPASRCGNGATRGRAAQATAAGAGSAKAPTVRATGTGLARRSTPPVASPQSCSRPSTTRASLSSTCPTTSRSRATTPSLLTAARHSCLRTTRSTASTSRSQRTGRVRGARGRASLRFTSRRLPTAGRLLH